MSHWSPAINMVKKPYVNNNDMLAALIAHRDKCRLAKLDGRPPPQMSEYLGLCVIKICAGLARRRNFSKYSYVEEMQSDAEVDCIYALSKFDPARSSNVFGFISKVAWNAFVRRIQKEKKQSYIKHVSFTQMMGLGDGYMYYRDQAMRRHLDYSQELVEAYEQKIVENKEKKRVSLIEKRLDKFMDSDVDWIDKDGRD